MGNRNTLAALANTASVPPLSQEQYQQFVNLITNRLISIYAYFR